MSQIHIHVLCIKSIIRKELMMVPNSLHGKNKRTRVLRNDCGIFLFGWFDTGVLFFFSPGTVTMQRTILKEIQGVTAPSSEVKRNKSNFICTKQE